MLLVICGVSKVFFSYRFLRSASATQAQGEKPNQEMFIFQDSKRDINSVMTNTNGPNVSLKSHNVTSLNENMSRNYSLVKVQIRLYKEFRQLVALTLFRYY